MHDFCQSYDWTSREEEQNKMLYRQKNLSEKIMDTEEKILTMSDELERLQQALWEVEEHLLDSPDLLFSTASQCP